MPLWAETQASFASPRRVEVWFETVSRSDNVSRWPRSEGIREIYRERVELYECLVENGYPGSELPSEEVFLEEKGIWNPTAAFPPSVELIKEAAEVCPAEGFGVLNLRGLDLGG